jgi:hypothetical protein
VKTVGKLADHLRIMQIHTYFPHNERQGKTLMDSCQFLSNLQYIKFDPLSLQYQSSIFLSVINIYVLIYRYDIIKFATAKRQDKTSSLLKRMVSPLSYRVVQFHFFNKRFRKLLLGKVQTHP